MELKCSNQDCAPEANCHEGNEDYKLCPYWMKANPKVDGKEKAIKKNNRKSTLPWSGDALLIEDLHKIAYRSTPIIIGVAGKADAGKTTYLAMLYTLLLRGGCFSSYNFCGTKTIEAWDRLYQTLKIEKDEVTFPDPTPAQYIRFLHLAIKNNLGNLKDIFISDVAGEVFTIWSQNRNDVNAENARWIYDHSNAFILFIDCLDLIERKAQAKSDILDLAQMLTYDIKNRPVIAVWSKSDKKSEVHPKIIEDIQNELAEKFINYHEIEISNFSKEDPDILVHKNNLIVFDWLLSKIFVSANESLDYNDDVNTKDHFFKFKRT